MYTCPLFLSFLVLNLSGLFVFGTGIPTLVNGMPKLEGRRCPKRMALPTAQGAGSEKLFQMDIFRSLAKGASV